MRFTASAARELADGAQADIEYIDGVFELIRDAAQRGDYKLSIRDLSDNQERRRRNLIIALESHRFTVEEYANTHEIIVKW